MTMLISGVLLRLLDDMKTGAAKAVGQHRIRTAVLQVLEIVPAELDPEDPFVAQPDKFCVKVSDASHSIYAALPPEQADLVFSNELCIGQYVQVDRLDPASPAPVLVGARPLPGRHPLVVGTPDPTAMPKPAERRRMSWVGQEGSPSIRVSGLARRRMSLVPQHRSLRSSLLASQTRVSSGKPPKIPKRTFPIKSDSSAPAPKRRKWGKEEEPIPLFSDELGSLATAACVPELRKLDLLGEDAIEQRAQAWKAAVEALHIVSATERVVMIYMTFSKLSKAARPDAPCACFDSFLSFEQAAVQAITDIEAMQAVASDELPEDALAVLLEMKRKMEIEQQRRIGSGAVSKLDKIAGGGDSNEKTSSSSAPSPANTTTAQSALGSSLKLAKQIHAKAGSWFMKFLEDALETGLESKLSVTVDGQKQSSWCCPQSLMLRVINWVEMEQNDGGGSGWKPAQCPPRHPQVAAIARKLRMKANEP